MTTDLNGLGWMGTCLTVIFRHSAGASLLLPVGEEKRHNIHIHWRNDTPPLYSHHAVTPRIHTLSPTSTLHLKLVLSLLYFCSFFASQKVCAMYYRRVFFALPWFHCVLQTFWPGLLSQLSICEDWLQGNAINLSGDWGDTLLELHNVCGYATSTDTPCYFGPILQLLCVIDPNEFGHFISSFTLSFCNTSKHAQKRHFWRHCEINWNCIFTRVTLTHIQIGLFILEYNMTFDKNCNHLEAQNNLKLIFWTEIQAFGVHACSIS